jgi:iron complex outermembrane recepter protein
MPRKKPSQRPILFCHVLYIRDHMRQGEVRMHRMLSRERSVRLFPGALPVLILISMPLAAAGPGATSTQALKRLTVEELLDLEITSVSRTEESFRGAPAALAIVTSDDLRRSGATSIPEALRFVPGLHIARQTSNIWAISSRGFSSVSSEKLLVLSDTRSIYTPLFSGVLWDVQDQLLEDIERIEVIRGPGAALWGSNAVNGVINITTKRAQDTQGAHLEATIGTEERARAAARFGGQTGGGIYYRVFGQYSDRDATDHAFALTKDDWQLGHVGVRADWDASERDALTLQGGFYDGEVGRLQPSIEIVGRPGPQGRLDVDVRGGNVLGRWRRSSGESSDLQLRAYYDHTRRDDPSFIDELDTLDIDFQHRFTPTARQEVIWGANYRFTSNRNEGKGIFAVEPATSEDQLVSGFVQDQIAISDSFALTLGSKFEHNDFSGFEVQPSIRGVWTIRADQTAWAAISRAVRVPTRLERDIAVDVTDPAGNPIVRLLGNPEFDVERLEAYELGYRWLPRANLSVDIAAFHNRYRDLASLELGAPFTDLRDGRTVIPIFNENRTEGDAQGIEALIDFAPLDLLRLAASYAYLSLSLDPAGADLNRGALLSGATPRHQFGVRASLDLTGDMQIELMFRHLGALRTLPAFAGEGAPVPDYSELDLRFAWRVSPQFEFSLVGQNLLHEQHAEFGGPLSRGEIERGVYGKVAWQSVP